MRLPHHLLRHISGVFHFRLIVPHDLRALVGLRVIKRSLQTREIGHAQVAAWHLSASYARAFSMLRGRTMAKDILPTVEEIIAGFKGSRRQDYRIDRKNGVFESSGEDDHRRAMEMMSAATEAARAETALLDARARDAGKNALSHA